MERKRKKGFFAPFSSVASFTLTIFSRRGLFLTVLILFFFHQNFINSTLFPSPFSSSRNCEDTHCFSLTQCLNVGDDPTTQPGQHSSSSSIHQFIHPRINPQKDITQTNNPSPHSPLKCRHLYGYINHPRPNVRLAVSWPPVSHFFHLLGLAETLALLRHPIALTTQTRSQRHTRTPAHPRSTI